MIISTLTSCINLNNIYFENNQTIHQNIVITYRIQKQAIMLVVLLMWFVMEC